MSHALVILPKPVYRFNATLMKLQHNSLQLLKGKFSNLYGKTTKKNIRYLQVKEEKVKVNKEEKLNAGKIKIKWSSLAKW